MINIDIELIAHETGMAENEIKGLPLIDLIAMQDKIKRDKENERVKAETMSPEYNAMLKRWFTPYEFLKQFFSDQEIVTACSEAQITERDLVDEITVPVNQTTTNNYYKNRTDLYEYLGEGMAYIKQYDCSGRELAERLHTRCYKYKAHGQYQHLRHGQVIKALTCKRYPFLTSPLENYKVECFGYDNGVTPYEIYILDHNIHEQYPGSIYTPYQALMDADIEAIKERNRSYAKIYNSGAYDPESTEKRLEAYTDFFEKIKKAHGYNMQAERNS